VRWNTFADLHLVTAFEVSFVGTRGEQPQSDVVEESRVPEVCGLRGNSRWKVWAFSVIIRRQ